MEVLEVETKFPSLGPKRTSEVESRLRDAGGVVLPEKELRTAYFDISGTRNPTWRLRAAPKVLVEGNYPFDHLRESYERDELTLCIKEKLHTQRGFLRTARERDTAIALQGRQLMDVYNDTRANLKHGGLLPDEVIPEIVQMRRRFVLVCDGRTIFFDFDAIQVPISMNILEIEAATREGVLKGIEVAGLDQNGASPFSKRRLLRELL
jgi:hypothetical protein